MSSGTKRGPTLFAIRRRLWSSPAVCRRSSFLALLETTSCPMLFSPNGCPTIWQQRLSGGRESISARPKRPSG